MVILAIKYKNWLNQSNRRGPYFYYWILKNDNNVENREKYSENWPSSSNRYSLPLVRSSKNFSKLDVWFIMV